MIKLVKDKNGTTSFMPIDDKTGGKVSHIQNKNAMCLTENQVSYVYKMVEQGDIIITETMKHGIEQEELTEIDREDDNPYKKVILNKVYKEEDKMMQMENWSILSNNVKYAQHDEKLKTPHKLDLSTLNYHLHKGLYC